MHANRGFVKWLALAGVAYFGVQATKPDEVEVHQLLAESWVRWQLRDNRPAAAIGINLCHFSARRPDGQLDWLKLKGCIRDRY
jgi:hypothetical protein